jgi:hypothetical protein
MTYNAIRNWKAIEDVAAHNAVIMSDDPKNMDQF